MKTNVKTFIMHLRFTQPQLQSLSGALAVFGVLVYWSKDVVNLPTTLIYFVHLGSFALHFGSQLWVTFIAGFIMFRVLSRKTFGHVQSFLFPVFFLLSLTMAVITTTTYLMINQPSSWGLTQTVQFVVLFVGGIAALGNSLVFAPGTITAMLERCEYESKMGVASVVGKIDSHSYRREDGKYDKVHMTFIRWHCFSSLSNVITLASNLVYMYFLASKLSAS